MNIRGCKSSDFEVVLVFLEKLWPEKRLNQQRLKVVYERALASRDQDYICVEENSNVIGFCSLTMRNNLWQEGHLGHIDVLFVDEAYRGSGIGSALLNHASRLAKECGCRRVELDSAFHRKEAHRFYEANGFENRGYLFSKVLDSEELA
ncbi:GNAT family N-acetyltransferase [Candidatus Hydrogenedentota bacterium]